MRNWILCILMGLLLMPATGFSQGTTSDPKAKALLNKVTKKYKGYSSLKSSYSMKSYKNNRLQESETGTLWIKGSNFKVDSDDYLVICDNTTYWFYMKDVKELQINYFEEDGDLVNPTSLFNLYENDFLVFMGEKAGVTQVLELTPIDKSRPYFKIKVKVNTESNAILGADVYLKNSGKILITFSNTTPNATIPSGTFTFDRNKYPVDDEIDLRE